MRCLPWRHLGGSLLFAALSGSVTLARPSPSAPPPPSPAACCGPITPAGLHLRQLLDATDVDHLWLDHLHVDWKTGQPDRPPTYDGPDTHSHCSDFAAAVGLRLDIYMLRPPQHPQQLLASAQGKWFDTPAARDQGWTPVTSFHDAQSLANQGQLVVLSFVSPDPHRPGHIAIVRPAIKTTAALDAEGPETTQAGTLNFTDGTAKRSFAAHPGAWPDAIKMYAHPSSLGTQSGSR